MKAGSRLDPVIGEYRYQARRQLREEAPEVYERATTAQIQQMAESLRWRDFRRHVEPLERQRAHLITQYLSRQADVTQPFPAWLHKELAHWDALIAIEARRFGYGIQEGVDRVSNVD